MDHPDSSIWAQVLHVILIFIIMISTAQIILSSVDKYENWIGWIYIEETVSSLFTIELLLRFLGSKNKLNFWKRAMNWVDLISIVPFYVSLFISYDDRGSDNIKILRIIRLIRVVRLLKLGRYVEVLSVFTKALVDSGEPLALFILFVLLLSLLSGTIMTAIEGGGNSKFNGIPMGIYWALTTLTTTGFGDLTPSEDWGKVLANITMIIGILIFSLPLAVIGANFQTAFSEFKNQKSRKKQKKKLRNVELKKIIHLIVKDHNDLALNLAQLLSILEKESNLNIDQNKRPYSIRFLKKKQQIIDNTFQSVSSHFESNLKKLRESVWGVLENVQKVTELICLVSQEWKDEDENQIKVQNEDKLLSAKSQLRKISDSIANLLHGQK
jgi:voltage-gated potassium channel